MILVNLSKLVLEVPLASGGDVSGWGRREGTREGGGLCWRGRDVAGVQVILGSNVCVYA